jgi:DNA-binding NarL/FixJ family response regulator
VALAVEGLTAKAIGERLHIGERTVETHLAHAYAKLGVRSRWELARSLPLPLRSP